MYLKHGARLVFVEPDASAVATERYEHYGSQAKRGKAPRKRTVEKKKKNGRGKTKEVQDPTKPKGPKGPYMCFVGVRRPQITAENPTLPFPDISRQLGREWKSMSEETRQTYNKMSEDDKARHLNEMENYVPLDEYEMEKLREKQRERKAAGGLQVMYKCSPELQTFFGDGTVQINRQTLTTRIWSYFKEHGLLDASNKRYVFADEKLAKFLGMQVGERFLAFTIQRHLSPHLHQL